MKREIESFLVNHKNISQLHKLKEFWQKQYERHGILEQFVVLGRFVLVNTGHIDLIIPYCGDVSPHDIWPECPQVMTFQEATLVTHGGISYSGVRIPNDSDVCEFCGKGWTLDNCADFIYRNENNQTPSFTHIACEQLCSTLTARQSWEKVFRDIGHPRVSLQEIPNRYWGGRNDPRHIVAPWFLVQTFGMKHPIIIGWRKHVINIEWPEYKKSLVHLFDSEEVTKDADCIHANGYEKAAEYLSKIIPQLIG